MKKSIYLDNNATTQVDTRVADVIFKNLLSFPGNPSSVHSKGKEAKAQLQKARDEIASYLNCTSREIIFTSGATESLNLILRGLNSTHIITSDVEHAAVYTTIKQLENESVSVTYLNPGNRGAITLEAVKNACTNKTSLIVLMAVNNETGVKTDIEAIGAFAKEKGIFFVVDGVALLGKEAFRIPEGVSAMCFSGHKLHGPKGIGFAFIRKNLKLNPLITGGDQEFGRRGGTENLPLILGLAEAVRILNVELDEASKRMETLRNRFEEILQKNLKDISINGSFSRIGNTSNICFKGVDGELLLTMLDRESVFVSLGSACASGAIEPSRVLLNMGLSIEDASSSIRFSLSRFTTEEEIEEAARIIIKAVQSLI